MEMACSYLLTKEEIDHCEGIKRELCKELKLSSTVRGIPLTRAVCGRVSEWISDSIERHKQKIHQLQSEFGDGSLVVCALSVKHFMEYKFNIAPFDDEYCVNDKNLLYIPISRLRHHGMKSIRTSDQSNEIPVHIILYNVVDDGQCYVYFDFITRLNRNSLLHFLKKRRWSNRFLRRKYPELVDTFSDKNYWILYNAMIAYDFVDVKDIRYNNIQQYVHIWIPRALLDHSNPKIQQILDEVDKNIIKYEKEFEYLLCVYRAIKPPIDPDQWMMSFSAHFAFVIEAIMNLSGVIGIDEYRRLYNTHLNGFSGIRKCSKLIRFFQRVKGRKCSFCERKEIRDGTCIQMFKQCARCKSEVYCSKDCQKRHWNTQHRNYCHWL
eukprot:262983_1